MSAHTCRVFDPTCWRCDLSRDELPKRIQRKRTKGWKMPPGAVYVGRPGKFGNPFRALQRNCGCWDVEDENGVTYLLAIDRHGPSGCSGTIPKRLAARDSVDLFAALYVGGRLIAERSVDDLAPLRGKDLACWCPLDQPCHADVLLALANGGDR